MPPSKWDDLLPHHLMINKRNFSIHSLCYRDKNNVQFDHLVCHPSRRQPPQLIYIAIESRNIRHTPGDFMWMFERLCCPIHKYVRISTYTVSNAHSTSGTAATAEKLCLFFNNNLLLTAALLYYYIIHSLEIVTTYRCCWTVPKCSNGWLNWDQTRQP